MNLSKIIPRYGKIKIKYVSQIEIVIALLQNVSNSWVGGGDGDEGCGDGVCGGDEVVGDFLGRVDVVGVGGVEDGCGGDCCCV